MTLHVQGIHKRSRSCEWKASEYRDDASGLGISRGRYTRTSSAIVRQHVNRYRLTLSILPGPVNRETVSGVSITYDTLLSLRLSRSSSSREKCCVSSDILGSLWVLSGSDFVDRSISSNRLNALLARYSLANALLGPRIFSWTITPCISLTRRYILVL